MSRLSSLFEELDDVEDRDEALVDITLNRLRGENAELARLVYLAAIPRRLDARVVGILSGESDPGTNQRLLSELSSLSFVQSRQDGGLVYHDSVRDVLLERLRSRADLRPSFEDTSSQLLDFYAGRHVEAFDAYRDVQFVAPVLRAANRRRLVQISQAAEQALIPPMLEVLYHATLLDPERGYVAFQQLFERHEEAELLAACKALTVAIKTFLRQISPETLDAKRAELDFWDGRLHLGVGELKEAEEAFRAVLAASNASTGLRIATLGTLGDCLKQQERFGEALSQYREQLRLDEASAEQFQEVRLAYLSIGELEYYLGELARAAKSFSRAIEFGSERGDMLTQVGGHSMLGLALLVTGEQRGAAKHLFAALDLARVQGRTIPQVSGVVASCFAELLKREHPHLLDTVFSERVALSRASLEAPDNINERLEALEHFVDSWQLKRAEEALGRANDLVDSASTSTVGADVLAASARLREGQGRLKEAVDLWRDVIARREVGEASLHQVAIAHTNRSELETRLGMLREAAADADSAILAWERFGHAPFIALSRIGLAEIAFRKGRIDEAERILDETEEDAQRFPLCLASHHWTRGRVLRSRGEFADAFEALSRAGDLCRTLGILDRVPLISAEATIVAGEAADWRAAANAADVAAKSSSVLAERTDYRPTAEVSKADALNAGALRVFHELDANGQPTLEEARRRMSECVDRRPQNMWYRLNLAYCCIALHDWREAVSHFDAAVALEPHLLDGLAPTDRAVDCLVAEGDEKVTAGDIDAGLTSYEQAKQRLRVRAEEVSLGSVIVRIGDAHLRANRHAQAEAAYLEVASLSGAGTTAAVAVARRGTLRAVAGDATEARSLFRQSLELRRDAGSPSPYWDLLRDCSQMGEPYVRNELLRSLLRELREEPETGVTMQRFKPRLSAAVPTDWYTKESMTLLAPDGSANVIASSEPIPEALTTEEYADAQGQLLRREFAGYEELRFESAELLGERRVLVRQFSWQPPDGEPVTQIQLYFADRGRGYTATATTPVNNFGALELQLRQVLEELVIEDG